MSGTGLARGRVYAATLAHLVGEKYFVVVSNNVRNAHLEQVLAVRVTTTMKPELPSIVVLPPGEVVAGRVICDDIIELYPDEVQRDLGALSPPTMARVGDGLRAALGI
jgi:mRNA interferase MazF